MDDPRNTCACGHRRRDHRIEGAPGAPLEDVRWFECEVCDCERFDGTHPAACGPRCCSQHTDDHSKCPALIDGSPSQSDGGLADA